ncbi:MAG: aminopeptidase P family N-terminal domain-containing protein [Oscillospiraceae bacterium]
MFYYSNYKAIIYSRQIIITVDEKRVSAIVPGLEEDHAKAHATVDQVLVYYEHPEKVAQGGSYQYFLDGMLAELPKGARVGVELGAIPMGMALYIQNQGFTLCDIGAFIQHERYIKSARRSP